MPTSDFAGLLPYRLPNIKNKKLIDPHVVIIGAGATKAACPIDKNGYSVPLLKNIHEVLGLTNELKNHGFSKDELADFELLYSRVAQQDKFRDLAIYLESQVDSYFRKLQIPDSVTLYDYLILSLTSKDAIISFNWDPFLIQAYLRNISVGNLPELIFPHGNVGVGLCYNCKNKGYANTLCPTCLQKYDNMPLLFPIGQKNYNDKPIIRNEWNLARNYLAAAAGITVYGYGAPDSDVEAFGLMKDAFLKSNCKEIALFTIINLKSEESDQLKKWKQFFDPHMVQYCEKFEETNLWKNPRVSLESIFDAILQQHPRSAQKSFTWFSSLAKLHEFVQTIVEFDLYFPDGR